MTETPIDAIVDEAAARAVESHAALAAANDIAQRAEGRRELDRADKLPGKPRVDRAQEQFIKARIGGADLKLQIVPDDLRVYAAAIEPPHAAFHKLFGDNWTPDLVESTLHFAALPVEDRERMAKFATYGIKTQFVSMPRNGVVAQTLATQPMAQYAKLAALVLAAALFGIPDDEAHFTDEADGAAH